VRALQRLRALLLDEEQAALLEAKPGDAGLLVDPDDPTALAAALCRLLDEPDLRETLSNRGLAQAQRFQWQRSAQTLAQVYLGLLGSTARVRVDRP
jgi:glycosyltransferase involved in cell wall biosynthesis